MVVKFPKGGVPPISTRFWEDEKTSELTAEQSELELPDGAPAEIIAPRPPSPCYCIRLLRAGSAPVGPSLVEAYVSNEEFLEAAFPLSQRFFGQEHLDSSGERSALVLVRPVSPDQRGRYLSC